jgi:NADH-quinone oxidoreductase subunit N
MNEFYKNLSIINNQKSSGKFEHFFFSCSDLEWQTFVAKYSFTSFNHLLTKDWWLFIWKHLTFENLLPISSDLLLYGLLLILILQFGLLYPIKSRNALFSILGNHCRYFAFMSFLLLCIQLFYTYSSNSSLSFSYLNNSYYIDYFTQVSKFCIFLIWFGLYKFLDSLILLKDQNIVEFPILGYLVLCFSLALISTSNFALLVICLEGFSLSLYVMATIGRLHGGTVAAVKYFTFGTAGSILILWGTIHFYEITSSLSYQTIFYCFEYFNEYFYKHSLFLDKFEWSASIMLIGFLIKLGASPIHQWVPDVYSGVPTFITAFYSIFVKFVLYVLFIRLAYYFNGSEELEYAAILSLVVGCFGTLRQVEIKRFLAYGSITHIGFLLIGDLPSSLIYLSSYILASFVFFSILLTMRINGQEFTYLTDLRYISSSGSQWDRLLLTITLASLSGLPPFAGFYGKALIWSSLIEDIYLFNDFTSYLLLFLSIGISLIIIFYYMRLLILIYINDETAQNVVVQPYLNDYWKLNISDWMLYRNIWINKKFKTMLASMNVNESRVMYLNLRKLEIKIIQSFLLTLLILWTLFLPWMLSLTV